MNARPQAWFQQAQDDLGVAKLVCANGFNAQACYFASQAAEKALKGLILELGAEPPHTHVLAELIKYLKRLGCDVNGFDVLPLRSLSRLAATSRYPMDATPPADLFEPVDANGAIATATAVIELLQAMDHF